MRKLERQKKTEVFAPKPVPKTPEEWEKIVRREFEQTRKLLRKHQQKQNGANVFGFADALIKRRMRAVLNTIDEVYSRYSIPSFLQYTLGELWTELNMPFMSYAHLDVQGHILFAASIWILDRITCREDWRQLYHLLPEDDRILDELCLHDAWDSQYDYELIYSVEHVLHYRNPVETDASGDPCTLTSELLAQGKVDRESQDRKNYESLIAMIPQKDIDRAVAHFKEYFWQWTDRLFEYAEPIIGELADCENRIQEGQIKCNDLIDSMNAAIDRAEKQRKKQKTSSLVMNGAPKNILEITKPKALSAFPVSVAPGIGMPKTETERAAEEAIALAWQLDEAAKSVDNDVDKANSCYQALRIYHSRSTRFGRVTESNLAEFGDTELKPMEPMRIDDPYELCFALLYMIEADDDLPWLFGVGCGLMNEVTESLPWGVIEYDEGDDPVWSPEDEEDLAAELPKSVTIPDWYARNYRMKGDDFDLPRSLAQILYEETGCILPRDLHFYDSRAKYLGKYGIRGKDAAAMLMLMNTVGFARRSIEALNLDEEIAPLLRMDGELQQKSGPSPDDPEALKAEIKRLRSALHAADKETREARKTIAGLESTIDREHRELSDLREYVFNQSTEEPTESAESVIEEDRWPYEVQKDTVVFGGHATWSKGIKSLLTGNVLFIDKDLVFDTEIIKHTEVVWIQPNAMAHKMYWRIMDTARMLKKPVRYFAHGSWAKCAEQVMDADRQ